MDKHLFFVLIHDIRANKYFSYSELIEVRACDMLTNEFMKWYVNKLNGVKRTNPEAEIINLRIL